MSNWAERQKKEPEPEPPRVICRQRYRRAGKLQRAQFINEIKEHELLQTRALGGVRIHREFCNAILPCRTSTISSIDHQREYQAGGDPEHKILGMELE
nr:unnamed protein product [Callosobruchus analis]